MLILAAILSLIFQQVSSAPIPAFGLTVSPKTEQIRSIENRDAVARRCAQVGDELAGKVHGEVGDVRISQAPDGGTVWSATLLMAKEPPIAPRMTCDVRTFTIANDSFDVSTPAAKMHWPYCGWGLSEGDRVGVSCGH